ncbi:hypothetical protein PYCC9005_002323 [Savitreella phatthalungensis]
MIPPLTLVVTSTFALAVLAHSWIDVMSSASTGKLGYIRGYGGHIDAISSYRIQSLDPNLPLCMPSTQSTPSYTQQYPPLQATPADTITANYSENGHVTKDKLPDGPRPGNYTWFLGTMPTGGGVGGLTRLGDLVGGGARVIGKGMFDDGKCAEAAGVPGRPPGPRQCQSTFTLPKDLQPGQTYQLVWLWNFPKVKGVVEMYTSCADLKITNSTTTEDTHPKQRQAYPLVNASNAD